MVHVSCCVAYYVHFYEVWSLTVSPLVHISAAKLLCWVCEIRYWGLCRIWLAELAHALIVVLWIVLVIETIFQELVLSTLLGDVGLPLSGELIWVYFYNVGDKNWFLKLCFCNQKEMNVVMDIIHSGNDYLSFFWGNLFQNAHDGSDGEHGWASTNEHGYESWQ